MGNFSSVECSEMHATRTETVSTTETSVSVKLNVPWNLRKQAIADILGSATPPPGWPGVRPVSVTVSPAPTTYTTDGQECVYQVAELDVSYSSNGADLVVPTSGSGEAATLVSESLEPTAEFITLDYRNFRWGGAVPTPLLENEAPGKLRRGLTLVRTHYNVENVPGSILELGGKVNQEEYFSQYLGLTFEAESLLFSSPQLSRTITVDGASAWTITLRFQYKKEGWNKYWRPLLQDYAEIFHIADESGEPYKSYTPGDFSEFLF